jgi:hypothetical protein
VQPFAQLQRPVQRLSAEERDATTWEKYQGALVHGGAFKGRSLKANWQRGPIDDHGLYSHIWKRFPETGIEAQLAFSGLPVGAGKSGTCTFLSLTFTAYQKTERALPLGQVPPLVLSEVASEVQTFAASCQGEQEWQKNGD